MSLVEILCYFVLIPLMVFGVVFAVCSRASKAKRYEYAARNAGHELRAFRPRGKDTRSKGNVLFSEQRSIYLVAVSSVAWEIAAIGKEFKGTPEGMDVLCSNLDEEAKQVFIERFWKIRKWLDRARPEHQETVAA